jgi:hypothetical protein
MCGERVRRCRAACRAQGGAGHLPDPEGPPPARARRDLPRFVTFPSGADGRSVSDRTGRGPAFFVELVCGPYSCRRVRLA